MNFSTGYMYYFISVTQVSLELMMVSHLLADFSMNFEENILRMVGQAYIFIWFYKQKWRSSAFNPISFTIYSQNLCYRFPIASNPFFVGQMQQNGAPPSSKFYPRRLLYIPFALALILKAPKYFTHSTQFSRWILVFLSQPPFFLFYNWLPPLTNKYCKAVIAMQFAIVISATQVGTQGTDYCPNIESCSDRAKICAGCIFAPSMTIIKSNLPYFWLLSNYLYSSSTINTRNCGRRVGRANLAYYYFILAAQSFIINSASCKIIFLPYISVWMSMSYCIIKIYVYISGIIFWHWKFRRLFNRN